MLGTTKHGYILNMQALCPVVSDKKIFHGFPIISLICLAEFIKGMTKHCYKQYVKALDLRFSEMKNVLSFCSFLNIIWKHFQYGIGANLWLASVAEQAGLFFTGVAYLDPRGMVGRMYKGDSRTLLNTKYNSSGPHCFRQEDSFMLSFCKSMEAICCHGNQSIGSIWPTT